MFFFSIPYYKFVFYCVVKSCITSFWVLFVYFIFFPIFFLAFFTIFISNAI